VSSARDATPQDRRRPHPGTGGGAELWIFRHGEVADDVQGLAYGGMDVALSPRGLRDSEELAERFRGFGFRRVVASTLRRARRLGELLAASNGVELELDSRLVEIDRGRWQGRPMQELMRDHESEVAAFYERPWTFRGHGGECDADVVGRAWPAVERALGDGAPSGSSRRGGPVAIACHYNVARNLIACALGIEPNASFRVRVDLTAAAHLRAGPRGWTLVRCNVRTPHGAAEPR
jgi:broad specificity phosphatase PhoE